MPLPDPLIYSKLKDWCVTEIQATITNNPATFLPDNVVVYRQMQEDLTNVAYPCITVTEVGLFPEPMPGDTEVFHWMLPFNILIRDREAGSLHTVEGKYMGWHQALLINFRQALEFDPSTGKVFVQAEVFPKPTISPVMRYLDVLGGMTLKFWDIETRINSGVEA